MLRFSFLLFSCLFSSVFALHSQTRRSNHYTINGVVKDVDSGIIRMYAIDNKTVVDSAIINKQGRFSMHGRIESPERRLFIVEPGTWSFKAFVEDNIISLSIDTVGAQHYIGKTPTSGHTLIWKIDESGSAIAKVYNRYKSETNQDYYSSLILSSYAKIKGMDSNDKNKKDDIIRQTDSVKDVLLKQQKIWIENYIDNNPSSIAGCYLLSEYIGQTDDITLPELQYWINKFSGNTLKSVYFQQLMSAENKLEHKQRGTVIPDFSLLQRDSTIFSISTLKDTYIILDMWASWCIPCRKAIPNWKIIYDKYKNKGFNIVSISIDSDWDGWLDALEKENMPWLQLIDKNIKRKDSNHSTLNYFGNRYIPFYVLLDINRKVLFTSNSDIEMGRKISEIIK